MLGAIVIGVGIVVFLFRYKKSRDFRSWVNRLRTDAAIAARDKDFRNAELEKVERELAEYPRPEPIVPGKRSHEVYIQAIPPFIWLNGMIGVFVTFMGLSHSPAEGERNWMLYLGPAVLVVVGVLILVLEKFRSSYMRVQLLNRKYMLVKAGERYAEALAILAEILEYYPNVPELHMEKADQCTKVEGRLDEAVDSVRRARELKPGGLDWAIVELSFLLRLGRTPEAGKLVKILPEFNPSPSDPRPEIYCAALELQNNDKKKAKKHLKKAMELDGEFIAEFLDRDPSLAEIKQFASETGVLADKSTDRGVDELEKALVE